MSPRPSDEEVRTLVRRALLRLLPADTPSPSQPAPPLRPARPVVDVETVAAAVHGSTLDVPPGALITPLARDLAVERRVSLSTALQRPVVTAPPERSLGIGADHGGYALKELLKPYLASLGWQVVDCGTHSTASVDYPDYAFAVARLVSEGQVAWGIVVDGAGIGSCMVANKVPGVRAALCYDQATAANSREHNHANVLTLGAGLIGPNLAQQIVKTWLETPFGPDRHARRVEKITQIERRFLKS